jgi:hypothetical protein
MYFLTNRKVQTMKQCLLFFVLLFSLSITLYAKDTVYVQGYYECGGVPSCYGTLNDAIQSAIDDGTVNNKVFKLAQYDVYVLSGAILMGLDNDGKGYNLEIVADKPGADQLSAPPQIVWTEETAVDRQFIILTYGNLVMKNIWVRYASILGAQVSSSITFADSSISGDDKESGYFEGCIFDYDGIGSEAGGAITIKVDHFTGIFKDCYFRNLSDNHFQYYGRAISFPYLSTDFHYDSLLYENCTFSNLGRIVMQEGNEYADNVLINHCTLINSVEWVYQSAGWLRNCAITNSIFVNPYMFGYRPLDVCDSTGHIYQDYLDGLCDPPGGGLINGITAVDSFGFSVPFTDQDRGLYIAHDVYMYQDWLVSWFTNCPWCKDQHTGRHDEEIHVPSPMIGENAMNFIDSMDTQGEKFFKKLNVDQSTIYDTDPDFIVPPTNEDTLKTFLEGRWGTGTNIDWAYFPYSGLAQLWPLPENMAYNNTDYQTAAMGGFPLGDLNWYPDKKAEWEAQRDQEWATISDWIYHGGTSDVVEVRGAQPTDYVLKQNYPNPFNPTTKIEYAIPKSGQVMLKVYNSLGQEVATIFEGEQKAGKYIATFDGSSLSSGVYFYRLKAENVLLTKKFVLMK